MAGSRQSLRVVPPESFGSRLRRQRLADDLTQAELGKRFGVRQQTIGAWERGERPQRRFLGQLAEYLGLAERELVWLLDRQSEWREADEPADTDSAAMLRLLRRPVQEQGGRSLPPELEKLLGHAFISYVREDSHHVDRLQRRLEEAGVRVWRDTADLWPGEDWRAKIRQAITDDALVFIACFSRQSLARAKTYQNEELTLAIEQLRMRAPDDPWLIPVRLDDCEIPNRDIGAGRTLTSIQRADLFGDRADEGATRLVAAVLRILGRDETPQ